jgi:hypothetical protein
MTQHIVNHEYIQSNGLQVVLQQLTESNETDLVEQIYALSDRPEVLGLLIYKLMQERKKTNELLEGLNSKYDSMLKVMSAQGRGASLATTLETTTNIDGLYITEQDKSILKMGTEKQWLSAKDVQDYLGYKGLNAASQRLNKLCKDGYFEKQRVGQQVVFVLNTKFKN